MKTLKWLLAGLLTLAAPAFAGDWNQVAGNSDEVVFVDRTSIHSEGSLTKARVLHSYSRVQTIGDDAFPHKSEILLYAVRCDDRSLGFEQWTMTSGELGSGKTIWTGQVERPALYKDPDNPIAVGMIESVCNG